MTIWLKLFAWLLVAAMAAFWVWGQDLLDGMSLTITPTALVLPVGTAVLCGLAWWVRCRRTPTNGAETTDSSVSRGTSSIVLLGLFVTAWPFAFMLDRMGHTPHQSFVSAAIAASWDAGGLVALLFCGVCALALARR